MEQSLKLDTEFESFFTAVDPERISDLSSVPVSDCKNHGPYSIFQFEGEDDEKDTGTSGWKELLTQENIREDPFCPEFRTLLSRCTCICHYQRINFVINLFLHV